MRMDTCSGYCAGCTHICEGELGGTIPVGDLMRYLMYRETYTESEFSEFVASRLPGSMKQRVARADFSSAEQKCPQGIKIGKLILKAVDMLA